MTLPHIVLLDNVDSFSYNLVDELRALGYPVSIFRNTVNAAHVLGVMQTLQKQAPVVLVLSPGPGSPSKAGCMSELLSLVEGHFPVIGICLGHQAIIEHFGGNIIRANAVMHGKSSNMAHTGDNVFADLPNPLPVARYHSLIGSQLPTDLTVCAWIDDIPMAIYHDKTNMIGFQFHPESILTAAGSQLLAQSITYIADKQNSVKEGANHGD